MTTETASEIVACPRCGQKNRLAPGRAGAVCGRCGAALTAAGARAESEPGKPIVVTDATYAREVLGSPMPVLLDCWASWCGPCQAIAPSIERLAAEYSGRARVCKLDVDANPRTAAALGVQGIPALFFLAGGRVVDRLVGAHPYPTMQAKLEEITARGHG